MSSLALRGLRAHCETTIDLARKVLLDSDNCLLSALETYEVQIESLLTDLDSYISRHRAEKWEEILASRERQKKMRAEIDRLEKVFGNIKTDEVVNRMDALLEEEDDRLTTIEEMKATIRRQLNELNSVYLSFFFIFFSHFSRWLLEPEVKSASRLLNGLHNGL
jgi:hypothetical protein